MDSATLQKMIGNLEASLDSLGSWLLCFTALVVIGLIVEYAHDLWKLFAERPFNTKLLITITGGILITVGVAGEMFIQFKASHVETDLRRRFNQEAQDARRRAVIAEAKTAELENKNLILARDLEKERTDLLALQVEVAPRVLDQMAVIRSLKSYAGQEATVECVPDEEARHIATLISGALQASDWIVNGKPPLRIEGRVLRVLGPVMQSDAPIPDGILLSCGDLLSASCRALVALAEQLAKNDLAVGLSPGPSNSDVVVTVGFKPDQSVKKHDLGFLPRLLRRIRHVQQQCH